MFVSQRPRRRLRGLGDDGTNDASTWFNQSASNTPLVLTNEPPPDWGYGPGVTPPNVAVPSSSSGFSLWNLLDPYSMGYNWSQGGGASGIVPTSSLAALSGLGGGLLIGGAVVGVLALLAILKK